MSDPIERQDAINAICMECHYGMCDHFPCGDIKALENLPSAQRKGKWIATQEWGGRNYSCSCCKFSFMVDTCMLEPMWNFCPNCGARMQGEDDE